MSSAVAKSDAHDTQPPGAIAAGIAAARQAFRDDLPRLLKEHAGEWVAYQGKNCLGFSRSQRALYQQCLARGLSLDDILVCSVEPDEPIVVDDLLDH